MDLFDYGYHDVGNSPMDSGRGTVSFNNTVMSSNRSRNTNSNNVTPLFVNSMSFGSGQEPSDLPEGYSPREYDVCCGRGKANWNHQGNIHYRRIIHSNVTRYTESPTKNDKTAIVQSIVDELRSLGAYFLKQDKSGRWYDIGDAQARDKVGHSLRDQVTALSRQGNRKEIMRNAAVSNRGRSMSHDADSDTEEILLERRRSSGLGNGVRLSLERRPSWLAQSFSLDEGAARRASSLLQMEQEIDSHPGRRPSAWDFLKLLDGLADDDEDEDNAEMNAAKVDRAVDLLSSSMQPYDYGTNTATVVVPSIDAPLYTVTQDGFKKAW